MDEDGFGMESGDGETVYAIIDSDLNIIEPFRPMEDIHSYLKQLRKQMSNNKCLNYGNI